jgi:ClpX C4-type zinc finger
MSHLKKLPEVPPPPVIAVNDRVLLEYVLLDDSVGFLAGHKLLYVGGREIGKVPCLALCEDKETASVTLYFCDGKWEPLAVTGHDSVQSAKSKAERIYPGSSSRWVKAHFPDEEVARYRAEVWSNHRCSFCGKTPDETLASTFAGDGQARICSDCVRCFHGDLHNSHI